MNNCAKRFISMLLVICILCVTVLSGCAPTNPGQSSTPSADPSEDLYIPTRSEPTQPVTEPTEPSETQTDPTVPSQTEPSETEPTEPVPTETEPTEPEPTVTEPEVTEPEVTVPEVTEPEVTEPEVTEPEETEPAIPVKDFYTAEDYLAYPDLFVPKWASEWQPPAAMLDFEEKYASIMDPDGRLMSVGHRADRNQFYPENSIEAVLSVIMAGADMVEVDIAKTKDGVLVLMHDLTLDATTNVSLVRARGVEGLPETNNVSDWTLEQLRELRLLRSGRITNYVIPTLEEVIMVCKGRCFITLDKNDRFDWETDVYPLVQKHEAYREVLVSYRYTSTIGLSAVNKYLQQIEADSGYKPFYMAQCDHNALPRITAQLDELGISKGIRSHEYYDNIHENYVPYIGKYRIYIETLKTENDKLEVWEKLDNYGYNMIMTNYYIYDLCQYIAEHYFS